MSDTTPAFRKTPPPPADSVVIRRFREAGADAVRRLNADLGIGMDAETFLWLQGFFKKKLHRDPTVGEVRLLAALAAGAHGAGAYEAVGEMNTDSPAVAAAWRNMMAMHAELHEGLSDRLHADTRPLPPLCIEDMLTLPERHARRTRGTRTRPGVVVLSSPAAEWEALAEGYRPVARFHAEGSDTRAVLRSTCPSTERPPREGDHILYCPDTPAEVAMVVLDRIARLSPADIGGMRAVGRRSLLLSALELCEGVELYGDRLMPGAGELPLTALCDRRPLTAEHADLILRVPRRRSFYVLEAFKNAGLSPAVIGRARRDGLTVLHVHGDGEGYPMPAEVRLPTRLVREVIGVHLLSRTLSAPDAESNFSPAPILTEGPEAVIPEVGMTAVSGRVTVASPGQGFAAPGALIDELLARLPAGKEPPALAVSLTAADAAGAPGNLATELICGLSVAAAERHIPLVAPALTILPPKPDTPTATLSATLYRYHLPRKPKQKPRETHPPHTLPYRKGDSAMSNLFEALKDTPRAVILDTDIGPDCDDVGAIVTLIDYAKQYGFPIAGICNCTSNRAGTGTIDAVCRRCGIDTPPLGQWSHPDFMDDPACHKYNDAVVERFSPAYREGTLAAEDEVTFYRRLLAAAADDGVMIISIGMFNDLAALLRSPADEWSPLTGVELVRRKVHCLVSMAAILPRGREFNVVSDYPSAAYVFANWPTAIFLSDFHVGVSIHTGYAHITDPAAIEANPLALAYHLYTKDWTHIPVGDNASYDLTAVQFAVLGEGELYGLGEPGRLDFYAEVPDLPDATEFVPDEAGKCRFMEKRVADEVIAASLNEILHRY